MKTLLSPKLITIETQCGNLHKANNGKEKVKTELFCYETVLEPNTKQLSNSPSFQTHTHMTLSTKWFRNYRILTINVAAEFRLWTEQRQGGSYLLGLGLGKTPEVPNTKWIDNSLIFPVVHQTDQNS
jgi:hypothetical protein